MLTTLDILISLLLTGFNIKILSKKLGHTDIKITMNRYSHILDNMHKKLLKI
ncbi:TPA: integrase [Clostridioides difficile]|uniref:Tyr recombinase domain-containing protein n=1 Tax=Clostridioides difficile NAP08 TaxID=525259 RepID=D5Q6X8_CLODI|nr:hypothetical protein [Clostridioides difficile]EFH06309.1 hypothetical protein HMPREF0220_2660 [Clostridioides difficile NAP08]EFH15888.1 hypothetical protein HMPREF0219_1449 [Clostridioides difficile NAP07]CCK86783.1 Phage integrase family site-specific recombinase [Clostridioides difficile T5]CCK93871.1 Phage integrase family site-specific recombinase [Clostridioides difficile T20]CCK97612.1 Phage integrase family site-specific recombinase [Clostridioides difficile E1]CCK98000.1 Phage in